MNDDLFKSNDDISFLCDDLRTAHANAAPLLALGPRRIA